MRLLRLLLTGAIRMSFSLRVLPLLLAASIAPTAYGNAGLTPWDQPAAALAARIAAILGPGQARLTLRNLTSIPSEDLPVIHRLLDQNLRAHGITLSGDDAANQLRITLSENTRERLWIAEIVEGNQTRVVMVSLALTHLTAAQSTAGITLHKQQVFTSHEAVLSALEVSDSLVVLEPERIVVYARGPDTWNRRIAVPIDQKRSLSRDARGILIAGNNGQTFEAYLPGEACDGSNTASGSPGQWTIHCRDSDDPWPITAPMLMQMGSAPAPALKAFYNATRDYYTGIVAPSLGVDLPAFYTAAWFPRALIPALLINDLDGKLQLVEGAALKTVPGARDWGSDFAALQSACGSGTQIVASGSGPAAQDSVRAYEIPALEAVPASPPLVMAGSVTALWAVADSKSLFAVVRTSPPLGQPVEYEVDRVTASCN
jgi:hypothetical protein